jgi:hypothetical protein
MPVSGQPGLILNSTGGFGSLPEREKHPVIEYRTARPGSSPNPGPPLALASISACRAGRPGRFLNSDNKFHIGGHGCPPHTANAASLQPRIHLFAGDVLRRSGQEILK